MYDTYIIKSLKSGRFYIGSTSNLNDRVLRHNAGRNKSTKSGVPWVLVYHQSFNDEHDAYRREMEIKSYKGGEAFKKLLK
jgi:putative endonuclease